MSDDVRERARRQADSLSYELAQATGLSVGRLDLGGGLEGIEAHFLGAGPADDGDKRPAAPHVFITDEEAELPTDEHGNFPRGISVCAYDAEGHGDVDHDGPLMAVDAPEAAHFGTVAVRDRIVATLKAWASRRQVLATHTLAAQLAERTGLLCGGVFTQAGTGCVEVRLHHPGTDGERYLQITAPGSPYPPVDGNGNFPSGVVLCEFTEAGPYPDEDAPPLLHVGPEDATDTEKVVNSLDDYLMAWAQGRTEEEREQLAAEPARTFDRMGGVVMGERLALAWGREQAGAAGPVRWIVALVRRESGELLDVVADTDDVSMLSVLVPVAAASVVRMKYPAPLAY